MCIYTNEIYLRYLKLIRTTNLCVCDVRGCGVPLGALYVDALSVCDGCVSFASRGITSRSFRPFICHVSATVAASFLLSSLAICRLLMFYVRLEIAASFHVTLSHQ